MTRILFVFILALILNAVAGCASNSLTLPTVGPSTSNKSRLGGQGSLQVFSAITERNDSGIRYYYHQNYVVYQTNTVVKSVINSAVMDEQPAIVNLPVGEYIVKAPSDGFGLVNVPVVIKPGALTEVHLDRRWTLSERAGATNLVFMPDGSPIGWRPSEK